MEATRRPSNLAPLNGDVLLNTITLSGSDTKVLFSTTTNVTNDLKSPASTLRLGGGGLLSPNSTLNNGGGGGGGSGSSSQRAILLQQQEPATASTPQQQPVPTATSTAKTVGAALSFATNVENIMPDDLSNTNVPQEGVHSTAYLTQSEIKDIIRVYDELRPMITDPYYTDMILTVLGQSALSEEQKQSLFEEVNYISSKSLLTVEQLLGVMNVLKKQFIQSNQRFTRQQDFDTLDAFVSLGGMGDETGEIDVSNLKAVVNQFHLEFDLERLLKALDEDGTGKLSFREFRSLFQKFDKKQSERNIGRGGERGGPTIQITNETVGGIGGSTDGGTTTLASPILSSPLEQSFLTHSLGSTATLHHPGHLGLGNPKDETTELYDRLQQLRTSKSTTKSSTSVAGSSEDPFGDIVRKRHKPIEPPRDLTKPKSFRRTAVTPVDMTQVKTLQAKVNVKSIEIKSARAALREKLDRIHEESEALFLAEMKHVAQVQTLSRVTRRAHTEQQSQSFKKSWRQVRYQRFTM